MKERTSIMTVEVCPTLVNSLSLLPFLFIQNLNNVHDGCWGGSEGEVRRLFHHISIDFPLLIPIQKPRIPKTQMSIFDFPIGSLKLKAWLIHNSPSF